MLVRTKDNTAGEWCKSVNMLTHRLCDLGKVVILDTKNQHRATVQIPDNLEQPTTTKDFLIKIYGVDAMGKVVDVCSTGTYYLKKELIKMIFFLNYKNRLIRFLL